ncbi:hypothetical protein D3C72_2292900 [compost metagenome]
MQRRQDLVSKGIVEGGHQSGALAAAEDRGLVVGVDGDRETGGAAVERDRLHVVDVEGAIRHADGRIDEHAR